MKLAIMQPYFFPYLGYWQLINAVDKFVVYDNIKYTKKGWINRNRVLLHGTDTLFTIPIKNDSDSLNINQRFLSESFERTDLLKRLVEAYKKAPFYTSVFPFLEHIIMYQTKNLFEYLLNSISSVCEFLSITSELVTSSTIRCDHSLKSQDRVLAICESLGATTYINPIGGTELYSHDEFAGRGIKLLFLKSCAFEYKQFENQFIPWLSIIDVLMFNEKPKIQAALKSGFDLI